MSAFARRELEKLIAIMGEKRLVGGNHIFPVFEGLLMNVFAALSPPISSMTIWISGSFRISSTRVVSISDGTATGLGRSRSRSATRLKFEGDPKPALDHFGIFPKDLDNTATDRSPADKPNPDFSHEPPVKVKPAPSGH